MTEEDMLELYTYQYKYNDTFRAYCDLMSRSPDAVNSLRECAYLPISLYKRHIIKTGTWHHQKIFQSSATTGSMPSKHYVRDNDDYLKNTVRCFERAYGDVSNYCFLALLPSYLERSDSSLIEMVNYFIGLSAFDQSQFYLDDLSRLKNQIIFNKRNDIPTILWGVSYALLDFAELHPMDLSDVIIMETGGMKGRRAELPKKELHHILCQAFNASCIHSEYGMTELLSQAYSKGDGIFDIPETMRISIRATDDPLHVLDVRKRGRIHIIDMANVDTCSFIGTDDLGILHPDNQFEIIGRLDGSEQRGCNLMVDG